VADAVKRKHGRKISRCESTRQLKERGETLIRRKGRKNSPRLPHSRLFVIADRERGKIKEKKKKKGGTSQRSSSVEGQKKEKEKKKKEVMDCAIRNMLFVHWGGKRGNREGRPITNFTRKRSPKKGATPLQAKKFRRRVTSPFFTAMRETGGRSAFTHLKSG